jgi:acyl-CoA thioester hydrolase
MVHLVDLPPAIRGIYRLYNQYIIKTMICECTLKVRTYECDSYGHVNNANYLHYLEFARYEFLRVIGFDYPGAIKAGYGVYVARIEINYKRPAVTDDELRIYSWPIKKGAVSGIIAQEIRRGEEVIVEAKVTWAVVDSSGLPTKLPKAWDVPGLKPDP